MHSHQLVVHSPPSASDSSALWKRNVLDDLLIQGHALACGDLLGLGVIKESNPISESAMIELMLSRFGEGSFGNCPETTSHWNAAVRYAQRGCSARK